MDLMMDDLVERLREHAKLREGEGWTEPLCEEAAVEIERLKAEVADLRELLCLTTGEDTSVQSEIGALRAENEKLRASRGIDNLAELTSENEKLREALTHLWTMGIPEDTVPMVRAALHGDAK